jgi:hypothetical protein
MTVISVGDVTNQNIKIGSAVETTMLKVPTVV